MVAGLSRGLQVVTPTLAGLGRRRILKSRVKGMGYLGATSPYACACVTPSPSIEYLGCGYYLVVAQATVATGTNQGVPCNEICSPSFVGRLDACPAWHTPIHPRPHRRPPPAV